MRKLGIWIGLVGIVATARVARAGEGGDTSLMVAAEIAPGVGLDGEDVRRVIADELHRRVVAPAVAPTVDAEDILLVSVGQERTVISFRPSADGYASRAIPTPSDRAARLRAVAWLAGNLARDQVSPLVLAAADAAPVAQEPLRIAAPSSLPATPSPLAPPTPELAAPADETAVVQLRKAPIEQPSEDPSWTISLAGGPSMGYLASEGAAPANFTTSWQGEVQHRPLDGWILGGAIDFGPTPLHRLGFAATAGIFQRWHDFRFEETLGVGVESGLSTSTVVQNSSLTGVNSISETSSTGATLYARAFVTVAHPLWHSWDVVLRIGGHSNVQGTLDSSFLASALGVRLRLP